MHLSGELFSSTTLIASGLVYAACLFAAFRQAPWYKLFDGRNSHVFFGALVGMLILWVLRTDMGVGVAYHLLVVTALTLMVGWQFALMGGSLVLAGVTLAGFGGWIDFFPSAVVELLLPITVTWVILMLARAWLPKHFFVFVFVNGFFAGAATVLVSAWAAAAILLLGTDMDYLVLHDNFIIYFPLMLFPEAILNGWIVTILVGLRPEWIATFSDDEYIHGK